MTMVLQSVWLYYPAAWRRTRRWLLPSGLGQGGAGGRLIAGWVLYECGAWCCAALLDVSP